MNSEIIKIDTVNENGHYNEHKLYFLGELYCTYHGDKDYVSREADKRQRAYDLIPNGCKIITKKSIKKYNGKLVGGIMEDSIIRVFGIANDDGIRGYSCSVYFIPSEEYFKSIVPNGDGLDEKHE